MLYENHKDWENLNEACIIRPVLFCCVLWLFGDYLGIYYNSCFVGIISLFIWLYEGESTWQCKFATPCVLCSKKIMQETCVYWLLLHYNCRIIQISPGDVGMFTQYMLSSMRLNFIRCFFFPINSDHQLRFLAKDRQNCLQFMLAAFISPWGLLMFSCEKRGKQCLQKIKRHGGPLGESCRHYWNEK